MSGATSILVVTISLQIACAGTEDQIVTGNTVSLSWTDLQSPLNLILNLIQCIKIPKHEQTVCALGKGLRIATQEKNDHLFPVTLFT